MIGGPRNGRVWREPSPCDKCNGRMTPQLVHDFYALVCKTCGFTKGAVKSLAAEMREQDGAA
jgi:hypothetical protein